MPERSCIERLLDGPPPASVAALGPAALAELEAAVSDARHRQAAELLHERDHAMRALPWPVRKVIAKALGG